MTDINPADPPVAITFTTVGYEYTHEWHVFCNSLLLQTDDRWFCQLINDGADPVGRAICEQYVADHPDHFSYQETDHRYNDWGHSLRAIGLAQARTKYWSTQNGDNYLMPRLVELTLAALESQQLHMVIFPCVHNYTNVNRRNDPAYSVLRVEPQANRCDAGSLIIQTGAAQRIGWNERHETADGTFIDDVMTRQVRWGQIPNVLMVHN